MAIKIGSNFTFQGQQPNFERDRFATKAAMKAFPETSIDDGHLSYCAEDGNTYQFKSANAVDDVTGKWRVFKANVDLSAYATKDSVATDLAKKVDITGLANKSNKSAPFIVKIATITIPHIENITGTIDFNIQSRNSLFNVNINVSYITNFAMLSVKVFNTLVKTEQNKLYYHVDTTNTIAKIVLYYNAAQYDVVTTKVTNLTGTLKLGYNIDNTIVDALPEGAIQVQNINYGNKNLFYATPKDAAGDPTFRAIDVADIPDLSSKYATKEKAFTKDTISTGPNQFLAGPINTQGNIGLRKIDISDIPNLASKYQKVDANGYQQYPNIIRATIGASPEQLYLVARPNTINNYKASPDWYFATDGTLQDITASYYNKTYLDDKFKVISASLNDLVSKTYDDTEVRQLISNNTSAIGTKADKSELSRYQPKYNADYVATSDISTLPITTGVIDLNGNQIDLPNIDSVDGYLTIMNGTVVFNATTTNLRVKELELSNVTISYSDDVNIVLDIQKLTCLNVVDYSGLRINFTEGSAIQQATLINSSIRAASLSVTETLNMYNSTCNIKGNVKLTAYNSFVGEDGLSLANGSAWYNTQLDISPYYTSGWVDEVGKMHCGMFFDDTITGDSDYAPQTKAVYNALQLKADKTQLADLATQTDFVDLRNKVNAMPKTVFITQAAYDALTTKDANTIYYING